MYWTAGVYKIMSPLWRRGVAIYYIAQNLEYSLPVMKILSKKVPVSLFVIPNYIILIFQNTFFLSVVRKDLKVVYFCIGLIMHFTIAFFMGLPTFALHVVATYPFFFSYEDVNKLWSSLEKNNFLARLSKSNL